MPVHERHHHVEQQQVGRGALSKLHGFLTIRCFDDLKAFHLELQTEDFPQIGFVFGDEDARFGHSQLPSWGGIGTSTPHDGTVCAC